MLLCLFGLVFLTAYFGVPWIVKTWKEAEQERAAEDKADLENMFIFGRQKILALLYIIIPVVLGAALYFVYKNTWFIVVGIIAGFAAPLSAIRVKKSLRRKAFHNQLIDALLIMNSCLKGGLSLIQAFEVLAEEMPSPMHDEITLLLREHKLGVPIEEALERFNSRMYSEELGLIVSAILVARETGGDLTRVFSRLITTIRDRFKLKEMINTLSLQGRLQGIIMAVIPFLFAWFVFRTNPHHFDIMFETDIGRILLGVAVFLNILGAFLIRKFSIIKA